MAPINPRSNSLETTNATRRTRITLPCTWLYDTTTPTSLPYVPRISTIIFHIIRHSPEGYSARSTLRRRRVARYLDDDDDGPERAPCVGGGEASHSVKFGYGFSSICRTAITLTSRGGSREYVGRVALAHGTQPPFPTSFPG